jgi:hypothetical protein
VLLGTSSCWHALLDSEATLCVSRHAVVEVSPKGDSPREISGYTGV